MNRQRTTYAECTDFRQSKRVMRRDLLRIGGLSLMTPALVDIVNRQAVAAGRKSRIKSCLLLFQATALIDHPGDIGRINRSV